MTDDPPTNGQRPGRKQTNMEMASRIILELPPLLDVVGVSLNCYEIVENISEYISMILQKDVKVGWYLRNASNCLSFCHSWIFGIANPE